MTINLYAPTHWDMCNSYGLIACQLARHLTALGAKVNCHGPGQIVMDSQPADIAAITSQPYCPSDGGILMGWPVAFDSFEATGRPQIALTMFESTKLPSGWADALNSMDAVIVPSRFCRDVFIDCGVTAPIHVAPLGIGEIYQPYQRPQRDVMTFLAFLDRGSRKGGDLAQEAFARAFGNDPNYQLVLKMRSPIGTRVDLFPGGNVTLIQQDMTEQELYQLYCSADVLINPNRGEGFGLLPREFAATGGISLATDWGGTADDIEQWGWPISCTTHKAHWKGQVWLEGESLGDWAEPDINDVVRQLFSIAGHLPAYQNSSLRMASNIHKLYSWRRFAATVLEVWESA